MQERREVERFGVNIPCKIRIQYDVFEGVIRDLSMQGALVESKVIPQPRALVRLSFPNSTGVYLQLTGHIARNAVLRTDSDGKEIKGFGCYFAFCMDEALDHLEAMLEELKEARDQSSP